MTANRFTDDSWRISSKCAADRPQCVAVALTPHIVGVKDTKNPSGDKVITVGKDEWLAFLKNVPVV